jgi:hypothetical protein
MKKVCQQFASGQPDRTLLPPLSEPIEADLISVAKAFVALQQARHEADYNFAAILNRVDVREKIDQAGRAASWRAVRSQPNATVFLTALLLHRQWRLQ